MQRDGQALSKGPIDGVDSGHATGEGPGRPECQADPPTEWWSKGQASHRPVANRTARKSGRKAGLVLWVAKVKNTAGRTHLPIRCGRKLRVPLLAGFRNKDKNCFEHINVCSEVVPGIIDVVGQTRCFWCVQNGNSSVCVKSSGFASGTKVFALRTVVSASRTRGSETCVQNTRFLLATVGTPLLPELSLDLGLLSGKTYRRCSRLKNAAAFLCT